MPKEVKNAVQHEDAQLVLGGMAEVASLRASAHHRNGEIAEMAVLAGERQHVRRVVLAAEIAIEAAQLGVAGDQAIEAAAAGNTAFQSAREGGKGSGAHVRRGAAKRDGTAFG